MGAKRPFSRCAKWFNTKPSPLGTAALPTNSSPEAQSAQLSLPYGPPNQKLLRELRQVSAAAEAVIAALRQANLRLPDTFPRAVLEDLCSALSGLADGTAENCRPTLEYARNKIPEIRRENFLLEEDGLGSDQDEPRLLRGMALDQQLNMLFGAIGTTLHEYRVQAREQFDDDVRGEEVVALRHPEETAVPAAKAQDVIAASERARSELHDKGVDRTEKGEVLSRRLQDSRNLAFAALSQIRTGKIVRQWFEVISAAVRKMPELIGTAGKALKRGADIADKFYDWWSKSGDKLVKASIDQVRELGKTLEEISEMLKAKPPSVAATAKGSDTSIRDFAVFRDIDAEWCPELVALPAGEFLMGSPESEEGRLKDEGPQHPVRIGYRLAIGRYPVTFAEYDRFCEATGTARPSDEGWGRGRRPVIHVSWEDAQAYCAWLAKETGRGYRLPSEAEWEYACRAGTTTRYAFGDTITTEQANLNAWVGMTTEVGAYLANAWGLHDMHGNVWEWAADVWHEDYQGAPVDGSAWMNGGDQTRRVLRGGSWFISRNDVRSVSRIRDYTGDRGSLIGFRVARTLTP